MENISNYIINPIEGTIYSKKYKRFIGRDNSQGYIAVALYGDDGKKYNVKLHRLIWEYVNGKIPEGYDVHHINHNRKDNRIENLELIEKSEHISIHHKGKIVSEESRKKMSIAKQNISDETRKRMSIAAKIRYARRLTP